MAWHRVDSLFARLLLLQAVLVGSLLLVFGALVYVDRNAAVARLAAEHWAPALRQAVGLPGEPPAPPRQLQRRADKPPLALGSRFSTPRIAALEDALQRHGVPLLDSVVAPGGGAGPVLWLQLRQADGTTAWFGFSDAALLPTVPGRVLLAVLLTALLLAAVSWVFTRRLTRPLEQLRQRMQSQRPGEAAAAPPVHSATPEVAAIATAYAGLLQRFEVHERERALLLAGVSHDLRSPLARIRMAADLLPAAPEVDLWRDAIVRNTQLADRLIGSFLDHVRIGELALDQDADLAALARSTATAIATATTASGHDATALQLLLPPSLPLRHTHPLLLERLLANLLDNAFQHGQPPVQLLVQAQAAAVLVEVSDAGSGLPEAQRQTLLQAFARGDAARSRPGTGLGLAIVARVVDRMGGTLAFVQRDGRHVVQVLLPQRR